MVRLDVDISKTLFDALGRTDLRATLHIESKIKIGRKPTTHSLQCLTLQDLGGMNQNIGSKLKEATFGKST